MAVFASLRAALADRSDYAKKQSRERDQERGYAVDRKRVFLAYAVEVVIILTSLCGAWLFAKAYGHNDEQQIVMMVLAPIAYAVVELCRVPLALSVRTHPSRVIKAIAFFAVVCAAGVTVKSVSQLGAIMFQPRLFDVVHAEENLKAAQQAQDAMAARIGAADKQVEARRAAFEQGEELTKDAAQQLANLPKDQCHATSGVTRDGRPWRGQKCASDSRIGPLRENLKLAIAHRNELKASLEEAEQVRAQFDRTKIDADVTAAEVTYREAILHSQLHSFAAMVFAKSPREVTDREIHWFLRIFVFLPAIFVAFASTMIAFTAVHTVKPSLIPVDDEGTVWLMRLFEHITRAGFRRVLLHRKPLGFENELYGSGLIKSGYSKHAA